MEEPHKGGTEHYTYADLLTWPEDERWELINGVAYNMSPAPSRMHQWIVSQLLTEFTIFLRGKSCEAYPAPFEVRLPNADEDGLTATTVLQPDITVVCDPNKLNERGCLGSPTLVVEVLSPDSATHDLREKHRAYERAGVLEYWVISPFEQMVMVFTLDAQGHYGPSSVYGKNELVPVGVLPGLQIDLSLIFYQEK